MGKLFLFSALSLSLLSTLAYASPKFNEQQLSQFEETNQCVNCDLSGATLTGNHSKASAPSGERAAAFHHRPAMGQQRNGHWSELRSGQARQRPQSPQSSRVLGLVCFFCFSLINIEYIHKEN